MYWEHSHKLLLGREWKGQGVKGRSLFVFPRLEMLATGLVCVFLLLFLGEFLNHVS